MENKIIEENTLRELRNAIYEASKKSSCESALFSRVYDILDYYSKYTTIEKKDRVKKEYNIGGNKNEI